MGNAKRYLAIDLGTRHGVATAGMLDGNTLGLEPLHRFGNASTVMHGVRYWDFPAMLINAKKGLSAFSARHGSSLDGVACASWDADFGLLDKTGHLLANPVHYLDPRTDGVMERLHSAIPERSLYQRNGVRLRRHATIHQLHAMALANSPLLDKAVTMLLMADLASYFLSGSPVQEYTLATTTGMHDAESRDWSRDTILTAMIPPVMMPEIIAPGTVIGPLLDSVAAECGLGSVPVIASGSHARAGAAAAVPARGDDWIYIVSGRRAQVGVELAAPIINDHAFAAGFSNEGGIDGSIRFVKESNGLDILRNCIRNRELPGGEHESLDSAIDAAPSAKPPLRVVNPDDPRLEAAEDIHGTVNAILEASGQPPAESRSDLIRLCVDSLALSYRHAVRQLPELTGRKYGVIHVVGKGAGLKGYCQAVADAAGMVVKAGPVEAKAAGNILMQAIAQGDLASLAEAREVVANSFETTVHEPNGDTAEWDAAYARFLKMI